MLYHLYELNHAAVKPFRGVASVSKKMLDSSFNPMSYTLPGKMMGAAFDLFETLTRRYDKPEFNLPSTTINGQPVDIHENVVWSKPFCNLLHFQRDEEQLKKARSKPANEPRVLLVAPLSGHYSTLLRGTVEAFLPNHEVFITDWTDARVVPASAGKFDLNDYIDYIIEILHFIGPKANVIAICQPGPPVLAAISYMAAKKSDYLPATMTYMGSPLDTRLSPTLPNQLANERSLTWFEQNMIFTVPWPNPGFMRRVYPGFIQLSSFIAMNQDLHIDAHRGYFNHLIEGDCDSVQKHREFYDEYLAVLDLTEEFYLQTIHEVFQKHSLPKGELYHRGDKIDPSVIETVALMTVEGERDDISGIGQTQAAHTMCSNIPESKRFDYVQPGVGHYGVFNGKRFRSEIQPRIRDFIRSNFSTEEEAKIRKENPIY